MCLRTRRRSFDYPDGWEPLLLDFGRYEMDQTVQRNAGHYMDEKTSDLVETMEYHRVSPHSDGNGIISECEAICTNEESF